MHETLGQYKEHFNKQTFRITFKSCDFKIVVLKNEIMKNQTEFEVLLDGMVQKLRKNNSIWEFDHGQDQELATEIWRQITLRYRL